MLGRTQEEADECEPVVFRILDAVAEARDEDVASLPPLGETLDPDALEHFVASTTIPTEISLEIYDCTVVINAEGSVAVARNRDSV